MSSRRIEFFDGFESEVTPDTILATSTDENAIHDNVSGEIDAITEKVTPVDDDLLIIEDSANGNIKKKVKMSNLPGASGGESNTASNVGSGVGKSFKQKSGVDLQFKSIAATANETTVSNGTNDVTVGLASGIDATKIGDGSVSTSQYNMFPGISGTGWVSGGTLSINGGDNTKFDLTSGTGVIIDRTDPTDPTYTSVSWGAKTAVLPTNLTSQGGTAIFIDISGNIVEVTPDNSTDANNYRDFIHIGSVLHRNQTIIDNVLNEKPLAIGGIEHGHDLALAIGPLNKSGNVYSANGANLNLNKSAGVGFIFQSNTENDPNDPNTATIGAGIALDWVYVRQDGSGGFIGQAPTDTIDADQYDDGSGTLAPLPNNKFQAKRIFTDVTFTAIQFGQNIYSSIAEAEAAIDGEVFAVNPAFSSILFRGFLIVKKGATDLTDVTTAKFISASKYGGAGGGSSTSTTNLSEAYLNSATPIITLSATPGEICIRDASSPLGTVLFEIESNDEATKFFEVHADKVSIDNPFEIKNGKELRFFDTGSSNHVGFVAPSLVANQIWILPNADGSANQVLTTDGAGNTTWATAPGAGGGEANTASSDGGTSLVKAKVGIDLRFKGLTATSTKISLTSNTNDVGIDVNEGNIDHDALSGFVANEHLDWTQDLGGTNIEDGNITSTAVTQHESSISHDALADFVANKHIDHSSVSVIAGDGLSGGGTIAANRTLNIDISPQADIGTPANGDFLLIEDVTDGSIKKVQAGEFINFGANTTLSNLGSTAINTSLISDTDNTDDLGSDAKEWKDLWVHEIKHNDASNTDLLISCTGNNGSIILEPDGSGDAVLAADTGDSVVFSDTGDVVMIVNDGDIILVDGSEGTTGHVWTSTGANGEGNWAASTGGLSDVVDDTTPQLGGNLDVNGQSIVSVSNADIIIAPNGTGTLNFVDGSEGTSGHIWTSTGTSGEGNWEAAAASLSNIVEDTTPQLGGDLDVNGNDIVSVSDGNVQIIPNGTGTFNILDGSEGTSGHVWTSTGTLGEGNWEASASGFSDPMTTRGDIIIRDDGNSTSRLPLGTNNQVLTSDGTDITWGAVPAGSEATPTALGTTTSYISTVQNRVKTVTSTNHVVLDNDGFDIFLVSTAGTNRTITLPTASANDGREVTIKKTDSGTGTVIIDGEGSETIDGDLTQTLYFQNGTVKIICNGTAWFIVDAITEEGTYSPDYTDIANLDSDPTGSTIYFKRAGDSVQVWGAVTIDPTLGSANGDLTAFRMSLPIEPNANFVDESGQLVGSCDGQVQVDGALFDGPMFAFNSGSTNEAICLASNFTGTSSVVVYASFSYRL